MKWTLFRIIQSTHSFRQTKRINSSRIDLRDSPAGFTRKASALTVLLGNLGHRTFTVHIKPLNGNCFKGSRSF